MDDQLSNHPNLRSYADGTLPTRIIPQLLYTAVIPINNVGSTLHIEKSFVPGLLIIFNNE
jgi:hypothetical protein